MSDPTAIEVGGGSVELSASAPTLSWDTDTAVGVLALSGLGLLLAMRRWMPTP